MALAIRLARGGAKKRPHFRIVVADNRSPRDGRFIERLGYYNPMVAPDHPDRQKVNAERAQYWLSQGAQPSDRVRRILAQAEVMPAYQPPKNQTKKNQPKAKAQERAEEQRKREAEAEAAREQARKEQAEKEAREAEEAKQAEQQAQQEAEAEAKKQAENAGEAPAEESGEEQKSES
jgi:small subunit ribosomal protein S16